MEIAAMMTGEQLEIGHELRQGTVTSARGSGRSRTIRERSVRCPQMAGFDPSTEASTPR